MKIKSKVVILNKRERVYTLKKRSLLKSNKPDVLT